MSRPLSFVIPGRRVAASPESMLRSGGYAIPGSRACARAPE